MTAESIIDLGGLPTIAVGDAATADRVVVLLHGFMMTPADLAPFAHSMAGPALYLLPEGPVAAQPTGRAWWHIDPVQRAEALARGPRDFAEQHPPDLAVARDRLSAVLDDAERLADGRGLIVAGFSQGGMVVADLFVRAPREVAALALLSSSRVAADEWEATGMLARRPFAGIRVLVSHGDRDPDLATAAGEALRDAVSAGGGDVEWVGFEGGHEIPLVVWRRLRKLIAAP